jgi:4-hydroxy-tetrahydrodipicolinate synthase
MKFRSDPSTIRGAICPVVTTFAEDLSLDLDALARVIEWQLESGAHGISVLGSTGETAVQTTEEKERVIEATAKAIGERVPFLPGTGSSLLEETLHLTGFADEHGADAVLVVAPAYSRPTQEGLYRWYSTIAREFPSLPIVIYNVPIRSAVDIAPETIGRLRRDHDNIVGIKETTRDFEHASYVLAECGTDFLAYCGIELLCYPMLTIGGAGHLSCVQNFAPAPCVELYDLFAAGRHDEAQRLHYELVPLVEAAFVETNPGPVKWAMQHLGILDCGLPRPPLVPPSQQSQEKIAALLDQAGVEPLERSLA